MTTHEFTLIVEGPDLQDEVRLSALFEAGCDDATVGRVGSVQYLDFEREAESFADAVFEATQAIESAGVGARAVHLEPDDLVTMAEIAERTGRTRESVRLLIAGERGPGGFPPPATHFRSRQRMWRWHEVAAWFAQALGEPQAAGDPLRTALEPLRDRIEVAFVYGSVARGTDRAVSDLDLMVITSELSYPEVYEALQKAGESLARPVNPTVMSSAEWRNKRAHGDSFVSRVAARPKLFLLGSEDALT